MPEKWDAEKDQRLLLSILEHYKNQINFKQVATSWSEKYGTGVSDRAITQHLQKLAKDVGGGDGGGATAGNGSNGRKSVTSTPSKPRAQPTPKKTPTKTPSKMISSGASKRKPADMSDEDDSEDERAMNGGAGSESPSKRIKTERRSKTPRSYVEPASEEEADDEAVVKHADGGVGAFGGAFENGAGGAVDGEGDVQANVDMTDMSDFQPELGFH
ncbi:hypothetical protein B0A55_09129 [Friedmanniomyces simplex]|uniref:Uncharacterized protein n=1 Tax=Friedmanniomyces simplex TaxID=329884 RepID=A0A4U0X0V3_9PEZI|nr:hypothetical protein B0A55_09129 [Friedmanniomyces simplex]